MKILRIANIADNRTGGMSRYIYNVTDVLRQRGHEVDLVFSDSLQGMLPGRFRRFSVPMLAWKLVRERHAQGKVYDVVEIHEPIAAAYAFARRFGNLPPLLVSVYALECRAVRTKLDYRRAKGLPVSLWNQLAPLSVIWQANYALRSADQVVVETRDDWEHLRDRMHVPESRLSLQHGGVEESFFQQSDQPRNGILFVGSWIERKGVHDLVDAIIHVRQRFPDLPCTIAGSGCPVEQVLADFPEEIRATLKVIPAIHEDQVLASLYQSHSIFAFPSTFEGQPLVLLEAAASGLAIVTTRTCGMKDFVEDGVDGKLINVGDSVALIKAIIELIEQPTLARQLGAAAREKARLYTWSRSADQFLQAATAAMENPRRGRKPVGV